MSRNATIRVVAIAIAVALGAVGTILYVRDPDVDTYWLNGLLLAPLLLIAAHALHRVLPTRVQWIGAIVLAPLGPIAYLAWPNDQWWNYGALTPIPLLFLAVNRNPGTDPSEQDVWYGGYTDGPWGPP